MQAQVWSFYWHVGWKSASPSSMNKKSRQLEVMKRLVLVPLPKQFYKKGSRAISFSVLFQN